MRQHTGRLRWTVLPVALRVVGAVGLCVVALSFLAFHSAPHASAAARPGTTTGTISSSPTTGPVGATISVSGSGWEGADGTPVSFGYEVFSSCQIVSDAQDGTLSGGSFAGWFRWPSGTPLNTYRVCAMVGNALAVAGSFTVLSSSPPAVSISPTTLTPGTQATITASNYYPAGTSVNFLWTWGNSVIENLGSAASDTSGNAVLTFTVSKLSITTGLYSIDASTSDGQPPTLFSSTTFTYSAPAVSPTPTPQPSPSPSHTPAPTMTPGITPTTTTPAATPTAKASATARAKSPTASASPTVGSSQTPATGGTNSGNNGGSSTDTSTSSLLNNPLLIGGMIVLSGALLLGILALLLLKRRRKATPTGAAGMPHNPNPSSYPSYNPVSAPDMSAPWSGNMPPTPAPVLVGAGVAAVSGPAAAPPVPVPPEQPTWLTSSSRAGAPLTTSITADPALEAMRRQAQSGLFVLPRPFTDERSQ